MVRPGGRLNIKFEVLPHDSRPEPLMSPDSGPDERKLLCRRYNDCLSYAAAHNWLSFGCGGCEVEERLTSAEQSRDLEGLAAFLRSLSLGG